MIRSFFAIDFPSAFGDELTRVIGLLKKADADVKWVRPGNVHLTLKFLGWVKEDALARLTESAGPVISGFSACDLKAEGLGVFPGRNRPRVVWVGLGGDLANLGSLQKAIEAEAARYDIEPENRPFAPHLTLGRVKSDRGRPDLLTQLDRVRVEPMAFTAAEVVLYQSVLKPTGAEYTPLKRYPLKPKS